MARAAMSASVFGNFTVDLHEKGMRV